MRATALAVHITAGLLGIIFGYVALYAAKGDRLHRKSGMLFVYALTTMAVMGATMSAVWGRGRASNVPVGLLTAYLVITGMTTVRPPSGRTRQLDLGLLALVSAIGLALFASGLRQPRVLLASWMEYPQCRSSSSARSPCWR